MVMVSLNSTTEDIETIQDAHEALSNKNEETETAGEEKSQTITNTASAEASVVDKNDQEKHLTKDLPGPF